MRLMPRALSIPRPGKQARGNAIAVSPVCWGVSEIRGWGPQLEPERVLREIASLGQTFVETGPSGFLPDRSVAARGLLKRHRLRVVAGPVRAVLHHHDIRGPELVHIDGHAAWLASLGAQTLVLTVIESRADQLTGARLSSTEWAHLLSSIGSVQHLCTLHKLRLAVQPRQGSIIEGPADIERLLVGSEAGVSIDIGHLLIAGADPIEVIELAAGRIHHVHVNDVDRRLAETVREGGLDYPAAVARGLYRPVGEGDADVATVIEALGRTGYHGWYGIEADSRLAEVNDDPLESVRRSLDHLRSLLPTEKKVRA
jgi:inosose dehydratase